MGLLFHFFHQLRSEGGGEKIDLNTNMTNIPWSHLKQTLYWDSCFSHMFSLLILEAFLVVRCSGWGAGGWGRVLQRNRPSCNFILDRFSHLILTP